MGSIIDRSVKTLVIIFGIGSGLFYAAGVNPQSEIYRGIIEIRRALAPNSDLIWWFKVLPLIIGFSTILSALMLGGKLGLIAIILGLVGGAFLIWNSTLGLIICGVAIFIGYKAFNGD